MKRRILIVTALLLTVLTACTTPRFTSLTGVVNRVEFRNNRTFVRYHLEEVVFDEGKDSCGRPSWIDVPTDDASISIGLGETVHVECYCDENNSVPRNACTLIDVQQ